MGHENICEAHCGNHRTCHHRPSADGCRGGTYVLYAKYKCLFDAELFDIDLNKNLLIKRRTRGNECAGITVERDDRGTSEKSCGPVPKGPDRKSKLGNRAGE